MEVIGSIKEFNRHKEDWFLYRERLEQYLEANKINNPKRQVSILLTLLDRETYEILHNLCYPDLLGDKTYNQLCKLLEHHFCQRISVLRERIRFYSLRQNSEETINDWQVRIKKVSKKCKFEKCLNAILVDKFLSGLYNSKIVDRICEEEFSTSKSLNDWIISVSQLESELKNESLDFQHHSKGVINKDKNDNSNSKTNDENPIKPINASQNEYMPNSIPLKGHKPYVRITEQPASVIRFRYPCEESKGSIVGVSSTTDNKTYPTIEVVGFRGKAIAIVSCVSTDPPHIPHPYQLAEKSACRKGVCVMNIPPDTMSVSFPNLAIQCIKKKDIKAAIQLREQIRIDPYNTGFYFNHKNINFNSVRLCIQVFLENDGKKKIPLSPVITNPIYDKKMMNKLNITKMSHCVMTVDGGKNEVILLCEKVVKEDIQVRFYENVGEKVVWENFVTFNEDDIHKNVALSFKVPKYKNLDITEPVTVYIQLKRPSDGETSKPLPFQYYPIHSELEVIKRKRYNFENGSLQREYFPKPDFQQQRGQTQNNFSYKPILVDELKEEVKGPIQQHFSPMPYFPSNWNSNLYLQHYPLPNFPTHGMQQMPANMVTCHNNPQNYNIQMNVNNNPYYVGKEFEESCHNKCTASSFNNHLDVNQSNDLNNISLSGLTDLAQFNMEQLSDQFLNSLSLDNIPPQ